MHASTALFIYHSLVNYIHNTPLNIHFSLLYIIDITFITLCENYRALSIINVTIINLYFANRMNLFYYKQNEYVMNKVYIKFMWEKN